MKNLKWQPQNPRNIVRRLIGTSLIVLLPITGVVIWGTNGYSSTPVTGIVDDFSGSVRKQSQSGGQPSLIRQGDSLRSYADLILVPATRRGGAEHWIHLRLSGRTLLQAGTDAADTEYYFPCHYSRGGGVIGLRQVDNNGCERITVGSAGWRSSLGESHVAQKANDPNNSDTTLMAQANSEQLTITPANRFTLLYVQQDISGTVVNVLTGSATIRSATHTTRVRAGIRYIDRGDGRRGQTIPIPKEVYAARPVQIFLDPNNWSETALPDIQNYQAAVDRQLATPITPTPDPQPTLIPAPSPSPNPRDPDSSSPGSSQPSSPGTSRPQPPRPLQTPTPSPTPSPTPLPIQTIVPSPTPTPDSTNVPVP
jgi:hypothetical protein